MRKTLTILSVTEVLALVAALAAALVRIGGSLIGIEKNLAKVTMGVRAIDSQTAPLEEHITQINAGLAAVGQGLGSVDGHLERVEMAVSQE
ncbi:MAG: hypothetical protein H0U31_10060 [Chloroflexia bacterium]|nr:hypothetical protein [Chloroflexia bacterium]